MPLSAAARATIVAARVTQNRELARDIAHADWGEYLYNQLPLRHALSVLEGGALYSRQRATDLGLLTDDAASASVIAGSARLRNYARLYFRPRTPTHYRWEGIKPRDETGEYASVHCAMPFTLRFSARRVLQIPNMHFTASSPARQDEPILTDVAKLGSTNWKLVFHDQAFQAGSERGREVVGARAAEVLIPDALSTTYLDSIVARSPAERDTLVGKMSSDVRDQWASRVVVNTNQTRCYHEFRVFVDNVVIAGGKITLRFGGQARSRSYELAFRVRSDGSDSWTQWKSTQGSLARTLQISGRAISGRVRLQLRIEGHLAFDGWLEERTIW